MKLKCVENVVKYSRTIEGMGEGLVLFNISIVNRRIGQNFHYFFVNGIKPPLDIAINPDNQIIEYISFFAQDEKIIDKKVENKILFDNRDFIIEGEFCQEKKTSISIEKQFEIIISKNNIYVLGINLPNISLYAYRIDIYNYLLFTEQFEFCGALLKNISENELIELQHSQCL